MVNAQLTVSRSRQIVENFRIIFLTLGIVFQYPKKTLSGWHEPQPNIFKIPLPSLCTDDTIR